MTLTKYNKSTMERITQAWRVYNHKANKDTLKTAYKNASTEKWQAWAWWKWDFCERHNGKDMRVLSSNSHYFTIGLIATVAHKRCFVWATGRNTYIVPIKQLQI